MSARAERGKRWLRWALVVSCIPPAIQVLFAPAHQDMANRLALAFVQFIVGVVVLGGGAFLIGWFTGKDDAETPDSMGDTTAKLNQNRQTVGSAEIQAGSAYGVRRVAGGEDTPMPYETAEITSRSDPDHSISVSAATEVATIDLANDAGGSGALPSDESLWAQALSEFESSARRQGLWAKVFAQARGDEAAAKAAYLRDRFAELAKQRSTLNDAANAVRQEEEARKTKAREVCRIAASIRGDPYASVGQRARLIEALGGQVRWEGGSFFGFGNACSVRLPEDERRFESKDDFKRWVDSEIIPSLLKDVSTDGLFPK